MMRLYRFDASAGRPVLAYASAGLTVTHIARPASPWHVVALFLHPGGVVGAHPAAAGQLLLVAGGSSTVSGAGGVAREAVPGCAVFWLAGEVHETRAGELGLMAIVLEGEGLEAAIELPPWDEDA